MRREIRAFIQEALDRARTKGRLTSPELPDIQVEWTREEKFGDFSTNIAMVLAPRERRSPREIAKIILEELTYPEDMIEKIEVAGPGFTNFFIKKEYWLQVIPQIVSGTPGYGSLDLGQGKRVQVEFVSANPTGPLHIGHGRGAALGDALSNILEKAGWQVTREYYINDVGIQMELLGRSTFLRYQQLLGREVPFISEGYQGEYIKDIAREIIQEEGDRFLDQPEAEVLPFFIQYAARRILEGIRKDLEDFGIHFDSWFSESSLHQNRELEAAISLLKEKDLVYEKDGALWQKAAEFEDEKDRVIVRSSGQPTYFASDIAYHLNKYRRGFDLIINIWGADHHGYVPRIKGVMKALGYPEESLQILLYQLVSLIKDGQTIAMSTRSGKFTTLAELIQEVGRDASRFFFLMRRADSHLEIDLDLAKKQSNENPVYYVQYAHARICSVFRQAEAKGISLAGVDQTELSLLSLPEEVLLAKKLASYPDLIEECALSLEPHRLTYYLQDLVSVFHAYYNKHRIISSDEALTQARLLLIRAIQLILQDALTLIGVSAPERM